MMNKYVFNERRYQECTAISFYHTAKQAAKAREIAIAQEKSKSLLLPQKKIIRQTVNVLSNIWTGIFQKLY